MRRVVLLTTLSVAVFSTAAHAEGCDSPLQPLNAQEKSFYSAATVLRAAVPQPPAGWQYKRDSQEKLAKDPVPKERCPGSHYYIGMGIHYERPMSQADLDQETAAMQAAPDPAKQQKLQELTQQRMALVQQAMAASQKQDYKTVDALSKQG